MEQICPGLALVQGVPSYFFFHFLWTQKLKIFVDLLILAAHIEVVSLIYFTETISTKNQTLKIIILHNYSKYSVISKSESFRMRYEMKNASGKLYFFRLKKMLFLWKGFTSYSRSDFIPSNRYLFRR